MDNLSKRQRANEAEWALKAQEEVVLQYRERLLRSAGGKERLARTASSALIDASSMLPQIAAQYVRVDAQQKVSALLLESSSPPACASERQLNVQIDPAQAELRRMVVDRPFVDPLRPLPSALIDSLRQPAHCARLQSCHAVMSVATVWSQEIGGRVGRRSEFLQLRADLTSSCPP